MIFLVIIKNTKPVTFCSQEKALKFTDRLAITKDLNVFEGMTLINTGSARSARSYEPLAEDPKTRELQIEERIANNVGDFLDNHVLQLRLSESEGEGRELDEEGKETLFENRRNNTETHKTQRFVRWY